MNTVAPGSLEAFYSRPRVGQRFSLLPGPFPRAQRKWKTYLPWRCWAEFSETGTKTLREALSLTQDTPENQKRWEGFIESLAEGRILLRIIRLHDRCRIPPGTTVTQRNSRLKRWLPPGWKGDGETLQMEWTKPTRFASIGHCFTKKSQIVRLVVEDSPFDEMITAVLDDGGISRWLADGQIVVIVRK